jgi:hypothetical protein
VYFERDALGSYIEGEIVGVREGKGRIGRQEREAASKTEDPGKEKDGGSEAEAVRGNEEDAVGQEDGEAT